MSNKALDLLRLSNDPSGWAALLDRTKAEARASETLTPEQKDLLDQLDQQSDDEWKPVTCTGTPISERIIQDRGER